MRASRKTATAYGFGLFIGVLSLALFSVPTQAKAESNNDRLKGRILLQTEENGEAWYVDAKGYRTVRYYMGRPRDAFDLMRGLGLGITNDDLAKITPATTKDPSLYLTDRDLVERLKGRILLQVEENGEAWYVHPDTGLRHYLGTPEAAFQVMREQSLGVMNATLDTINTNFSMIELDLTGDGTFETILRTEYEEVLGGHPDRLLLLESDGSFTQDISGWTIRDRDGAVYRVPEGRVLPDHDEIYVNRYYNKKHFIPLKTLQKEEPDVGWVQHVAPEKPFVYDYALLLSPQGTVIAKSVSIEELLEDLD